MSSRQALIDNSKFFYYNGLGSGIEQWHETRAFDAQKRAGITLEHKPVDWYSKKSYQDQLDADIQYVQSASQETSGFVVIEGSSAGGQHVLNILDTVKDECPNVVAVTAHGWVKPAETDKEKRILQKRARLNPRRELPFSAVTQLRSRKKLPAPRFIESLNYLGEKTLPNLSDSDKLRILILTQWTDLVVPKSVRGIDGVRTHKSKWLSFGHSGGYIAHFMFDMNVVLDWLIELQEQ